MNVTIYNKAQAKQILSGLFYNIADGKEYRLSFEEVKQAKTKKQLGFIFGGIVKSLCLFFNDYGYNFTPEQIKEWLYSEIGVRETLFLPNGQQKEIIKTLSGMDKAEVSKFIFDVLRFIDESDALVNFILPVDLRYCWVHNIDERIIEEVQQLKYPELDEKYLNYQRKQHCIRCGKVGHQAHHIKRGSGLGRKNPDWFTIPICSECHQYLHSSVGEDAFLQEIKYIHNGLDIRLFCRVAYYLWKYSFSI